MYIKFDAETRTCVVTNVQIVYFNFRPNVVNQEYLRLKESKWNDLSKSKTFRIDISATGIIHYKLNNYDGIPSLVGG